jgi:hypothetical protein
MSTFHIVMVQGNNRKTVFMKDYSLFAASARAQRENAGWSVIDQY